MSVTINVEPCGRIVGGPFRRGNVIRCGDGGVRCDQCRSLGERLSGAGYDLCEFASGNHASYLAWNLTIAALLESAAAQAVRQLLDLEAVLSKGVRDVLAGPPTPWADEPIAPIKKVFDEMVVENPERFAELNREFDEIAAAPGGIAALESTLLGLGKDKPS